MMKRYFSLLACIVFIIGCISIPASAALVSPEVDDVISDVVVKDQNEDAVDLWFVRQDKTPDNLKPSSSDERVIASYDVEKRGEIEYPVTVTMKIAGIKKSSKLYVLAVDANGKVKKINVVLLGNGKVSFMLDKDYEAISFITDKKSTSIGTSDKTGDFATPCILSLLMIAGAAVVISGSKAKEN